MLPTPVGYGGMPAQRFWEIEDGTVRFGALDTGRTDLARMILAEFALTYGNDWFVVPVDLPVGSVASVEGFTVVDTFGIPTEVTRSVAPSAAVGSGCSSSMGWRRVADLFFLAPAVAEVSESPPTEHVVFFRDEMANVVWGVERIYRVGRAPPSNGSRNTSAASASSSRSTSSPGTPSSCTGCRRHPRPLAPVRPRSGRRRRPDLRCHPAGTSCAGPGPAGWYVGGDPPEGPGPDRGGSVPP